MLFALLKNFRSLVFCFVILAVTLTGCKKDDDPTSAYNNKSTGSLTFNGSMVGMLSSGVPSPKKDTVLYSNKTAAVVYTTGAYYKKQAVTILSLSAPIPRDSKHFYDSCYVSLMISGSSTGTYTVNSSNRVTAYFVVHQSLQNSITGTINITKYEGVGGNIEGNFNSTLVGLFNDTLNISGNFVSTRLVDVDSLVKK